MLIVEYVFSNFCLGDKNGAQSRIECCAGDIDLLFAYSNSDRARDLGEAVEVEPDGALVELEIDDSA